MLKNKVIILAAALLFALPIYSEEADSFAPDNQVIQEEAVLDEINNQTVENDDKDLSLRNDDSDRILSPYKKPVSKKRIALKFLLAMLGVGISSFVIYFGLTLYNRIRDGFITPDRNDDSIKDGDSSLNTPQNMSDAVKTFVEKTHWD